MKLTSSRPGPRSLIARRSGETAVFASILHPRPSVQSVVESVQIGVKLFHKPMPEPQTIAVLGAGTMGNGIAHVCARSGCNVLLCDLEQSFLDRGLAAIEKNLAREVSKEKLTRQQADEARACIRLT